LNVLSAEVGSIDEEFDMLGEEVGKIKAETSADFSEVIEDVVESVATIRTDVSQGTGFFIAESGYLISNYHVVEGANAAGVFTYDGETHRVSLIGYNDDMDLAVLKINMSYPVLELGDSDDISIGEKVVAIGNPLGLQFSVSEGIVSALNRPGSTGQEVYIQTDAALNPGNSGGPLINKEGVAIGINNFKINSGESLGFALESNEVKKLVNEISQTELEVDLV
jgi:serine protease Do